MDQLVLVQSTLANQRVADFDDFDPFGALNNLQMWPLWGFTHLICAPVYAALFLYGFHSKTIWGEVDPIPLVYRDQPLEQQP